MAETPKIKLKKIVQWIGRKMSIKGKHQADL